MAILDALLRTTTTACTGVKRLGGATAAALAGGVLLSGAAFADPLAVGPAAASDITPSAVVPGDLEPGDTISIGISVTSEIPTFNSFDGSVQVWDGEQLLDMATSVDISVLGSGGVVQSFVGGAVFNNDPNCNGSGPTNGGTSASWSGMSLIPGAFTITCTIAVDVKLPDDIPPGVYTLTFDDLTGLAQPIQSRVQGAVSDVTPTGTATAFSAAIANVDITVVADTTGPDGTITAPTGTVAPGEVFAASIVFDEPIIGFDSSDVSVGNGTLSDFVANTDENGDTESFNFNVTAGVVGSTTIDVAAGGGQDAAGNDNAALAQAIIIVGGELSISMAFLGDPPEPGETASLRFTIQNSDDTETGDITFFTSNIQENLTGLQVSGAATANTCGSTPSGTTFLIVTGGSVAPSSSCILEFDVLVPVSATPDTYRVATSSLSYSYPIAGVGVGDAASTLFTVEGAEGASTPLAFSKSFTDDPVLPGGTVRLEYTIVPEEGTSASSLAFTDDLDAVLTGLAATGLPQTDVCGTGSTLSGTDTISLTGGNLADGETCTFSVTVQTPTGSSGDFVSSTSELTGNQDDGSGSEAIDTGSIASDTLTLINQVPQVVVSGPAGPVPEFVDFDVTIEFSEPVTGFLIGEIDTTNAIVSNLTTSDNETFTFTLAPNSSGTVTVQVPAGVAEDGDSNSNLESNLFSVEAESADPEIGVQFVGASSAVINGAVATSATTGTDFGTVDVNVGEVTKTLRISNSGVGNLTILSIGATDLTNFTYGAVPGPIASGASADVEITFDPTTASLHPSTITITSDDTDATPFTFLIEGRGGSAPEINVTGNSVNIADGATTVSAADLTDFGELGVGQGSDNSFVIENLGSNTLNISSVAILNNADGVFSVIGQPASQIAAGLNSTFTVEAAPSVPGTFTAQVSIESDDADESPYTFAIQVVATGEPEVDLQGNSVSIVSGDTTPATSDDTDFGDVAVGSTATATFTIENTGNADLVLSAPSGARGDIVERQSGSTDFTITDQPAGPIAPGGSDTFTIQFAPSAAGSASAVFAFGTNDADEDPYTFTVGGEGALGSLSIADVTVDEGAGTATFTVTLSQNAGVDVTVDYATSNGTATAGSDYTAAAGTATISTGNPSTTFTVPITDDGLDEPDETFTVTLSNPISGATISDDTATGTITDNDATPSLDTSTFALINESGGELTLVADLSGPTFQDVIVGYATDSTPGPGTPGIATADDVVAEADTFTIPAGDTRGSFTITIIDDAIDEGLEEFGSVFVTSITNATGTIGGNWEFEITDNDAPPTVSISDATVDEGAGTASFTVSLSGQISTSVSVDFATADGTAAAGSDYTANSGTVTFDPLDTEETITVSITDDAVDELDETFTVTLSNVSESFGGVTISDDSGLGTITDNDAAPEVNMVAQLYRVDEDAGSIDFQFALSGQSSRDVTVDYRTSDIRPTTLNSAQPGEDYTDTRGTATILAGETIGTITVPILDDFLIEQTEQFVFIIENPTNATLGSNQVQFGTIRDVEPGLNLRIEDVTVNEGDGVARFRVLTDVPSVNVLNLEATTNIFPAGTAGSIDIQFVTKPVTINPFETEAFFEVNILDDPFDELVETFPVNLIAPNQPEIIFDSATGTIIDNDDPPSVSIADLTVNESAGTASFTVTMSQYSPLQPTVDFATSDGTALAGSDYTATSGTLNFFGVGDFDFSQTVTVPITSDTLDEVDETFTVTLSNPVRMTLDDSEATGTITDDDAEPTLSIADVTVGEGDGTATFTVSLSAASSKTVTVDYGTSDATATDPDDYTATSGTLTFTPGDTEETFTVAIVDDGLDEADEIFGAGLVNPTNATIADDTAEATITDNDAAPSLSIADVTVDEGAGTATFTVSLDAPSGQTVGVGYATADGTATAGRDFTAVSDTLSFAPGDTEETFTVSITDDAQDEADETFFVGLESATNASVADDTAEATITDNDAPPTISIADVTVDEGDGTASFDVTLSTASGFTVTVDFASTEGTATSGVDFTGTTGTLTFTPGDVSETVTVSITDDALDEVDETFTVDLSNPANATIDDGSGDGTITDNDVAPELSIADVTISEDGGNAIFTVTQSAVSAQTVTVDFTTTDGTATAGSDFTANSGSLTINAGDTEGTVTVAITDDGVVEPDETFTVDLSNPANATIVTGTATGTITNDDAAPVGYTASFDADPINDAGSTSASFTFADAVVGTTYNFTISSDGGGSDVTGSGSVASASEQVTGIDVSGLGDGTLTLSVTLTDTFGNEGDATGDTTSKETSLPGVAITTGSADPVSGAFTVTVTFDEDVTGFAASDLVVSNGTAGRSITTSASVYVVEITPDGDGTITVDVPAGVAEDAAGNPNAAADQFTIESDSTPPGVTISTLSSDPVSGAFSVTFTFTEDVTGFELADITVGNGTASDFVADSATVYTATITPTADGTVTVDVSSGAADDAAGNGNSAATQFSIESDGSAPTVLSLVFSDTELRLEDVGSQQTATVTFSEALDPSAPPVLTAPDLGNLGDTLSFVSGAFSDGDTVYTATFSVSDGGLSVADIDVAVNGATDPAGNVMAEFIAEDAFSIEMRRGGITVAQSVIGSIDGEFDFSGGLGDFTITTVGQTGSQAFTDLAEGEYAITLAEEDGFSITGLACNGGTTAVDLGTNTATVTLAPGDAVECTFEATADAIVDETTIPVTIPLVLPSAIDDPTSVSFSFPLTNNGGVAFDFSIVVDQPWLVIDPSAGTIPAGGTLEFTISLTDAVLDLPPGAYTANITVTQTIPAGSTSAGGTQSSTPQVITIPVTVQLAPREGTLTLVATTSPSIAGEGAFTYSSDIAGLDGLTLTTVGGTASSEGLTVLRGSYEITQAVTEGWRLDSISCTGDTDGGSTFDVANGTATIDLDPEEVMVCTFANRRDEDFIREVTQSAIRSFMAARADQILTHSPDVSRRLRGDRAGATPNSFTVDMTENRLNATMSTSLSAIRQAASERENRMPGEEGFSLAGETGASSLDVWFQASYSSVTDDRAGLNADTEFGMYAFGVDVMASETILVGALVQFDQAETVTGEYRSQVEGDGWLAGPYMAARLTDTLVFDARVAWGQSDNQVNPIGTYWDDFETDRWLAEANLVGDWNVGAWRISPELGVAYFSEEQAQYTDSLGFVIPSQEITLGRITAGPEIAYRFETDAGGVFEPFIRVTAVYDYDDTEVININGNLAGLGNFRADARLGLAAEFANGGRLTAEAGLSGLGEGDFEANTAMLRLRLPLSLQ